MRPHLLFFADDYRVLMLNPATRKVSFVAGLSDFYVSPDGRWVAGYASAGPREPQAVGVISLVTGKCVVVPDKVAYVGSNFAFYPRTPSTGFSPSGDAVVVATGGSKAVQYSISSLRQACPSSMTRKP